MKAKTKTVEQQLRDSETQRQRALGAQESLREEVRLLQDTVRCKDEVIVAQATAAGHLEEAASKERTNRIAAETALKAANERAQLAQDEAIRRDRVIAAYEGRFAMLRELGTIPAEAAIPEPPTFHAYDRFGR